MSNYYTGAGLGINGLGQAADAISPQPPPSGTLTIGWQPSGMQSAWALLSMIGGALSAYHGYRRSRGSLGWTVGWFFLGSALPVLALPVAVAQGFGKPETSVSRNKRRRRVR